MLPFRSETERYRQPPAQTLALRELLEVTLEWNAGRGAGRSIRVDGERLRVTPLAAGDQTSAVLCESEPGRSLPGYGLRRRARDAIARRAGRQLVIFTDAAHSALVWSWETRDPGGPWIYRELSFRPGQAWGPLRPVLESVRSGRAAATKDSERASGRAAVAGFLARACPGIAPVEDTCQEAQRVIAALTTPDELRRFWRAALSFRILDPCCGSGGWLLGALRGFAPVYEGCLERMRSWIDDAERERPRARRERMRDFRRVVQRAGGARDAEARRRFSIELALLQNIHGADPDAGAVAECRRRLVAELGAEGGPPPSLLEVNVRAGDPALGVARCDELEELLERAGAVERRRAREEVETLHRASHALRRLHLDMPTSTVDLGRACSALARRLDLVSEEIDRMRGRSGSRHSCLHPVVEYEGALSRGEFGLIRGRP